MGFARERLGDAYSWEWRECLVDLKMVGIGASQIMIFMSVYRVIPCKGYLLFCVPPAMIVQPLMDCLPHDWPKPGGQVYEMEHKNRCYAFLSIPY